MKQFVCDGTCAGNELGDCSHDEAYVPTEAELPESIPTDGFPYQEEEDTIKMTDDELQDCLTRASIFPGE